MSETVRRRTAEDGAATDADYAGAGGLGSNEAAAGRLLQGGRLSTQERACLKILWMVAKSISHHPRNPGMMRSPRMINASLQPSATPVGLVGKPPVRWPSYKGLLKMAQFDQLGTVLRLEFFWRVAEASKQQANQTTTYTVRCPGLRACNKCQQQFVGCIPNMVTRARTIG